MIPADIDNFLIVKSINNSQRNGFSISICDMANIIKEISNMAWIEALVLDDLQIRDISALANCVSLSLLELPNNKIQDISPLSKCVSLIFLDLSYNKIINISAISECTLSLSCNDKLTFNFI